MAAAQALLEWASGVLFDFDGPVCRLFPRDSSRPLADELRRLVTAFGLDDVLTGDERTGKDPHLVLRAVHRAAARSAVRRRFADVDFARLVGVLEATVTEGELAAVRVAWPTPDADAFIGSLADRGLSLAVVTNNSPRAVERYLGERGLEGRFKAIHGRTADPGLMKPHPDVVRRALAGLGLPPQDAVMIGDTPTDLEAALEAGVGFIGYGRNEAKRKLLRDAGAKVVLGAYAPLTEGTGGLNASFR
ncbi:hydrolase [Streptomyces curacoi]|uniref:Hydrolase n=1 Tax=Streptomyces curacoi TaxID=146536 RepID=A0A117P394_9ACTN|nr:hydrolase [Streptomyces curacoi]